MEEYVWFLYGGSSNLIYGSDIIKSEEGAQQGCGLASMLFSGPLMRKVAQLNQAVPGLVLNKWFIDDGVLAGPSSVVMKTWKWIEAHFPAGGMDPNPSKCQLTVHLEDKKS